MSVEIPVSQLTQVLRQNFKTKRLIGTGNSKGYMVNLDRPLLPIFTRDGETSGADLIAMLAKLDDWEATIKEVRQGILEIIAEQVPAQ